ncbi:DUF2523 family protein [Alkanindiges illinoisensis]|uniref:DUF2523 family protein n=1 Tax=Alkanindiges illinoisensis TaxID=197183 RepID=UPI0004798AA8|nr:DUF2523 family protein [Alkanindiges illinoisensis]
MGFWSKVTAVVESSQKGFLKNVLTGAGVMLTSSAIFMTTFTAAVDKMKSMLGGVPSDVLAFAHLLGLDLYMSLILSAYLTRMALNASKLTLRKAT